MKYTNKIVWLSLFPQHPWVERDGDAGAGRNHGEGDQQVHPHPEVVDTELDTGETVLLQMESTVARIWQGLKQSWTLQEISQQLQVEYAVEAEQAARSVLALVNELWTQHLVQRRD